MSGNDVLAKLNQARLVAITNRALVGPHKHRVGEIVRLAVPLPGLEENPSFPVGARCKVSKLSDNGAVRMVSFDLSGADDLGFFVSHRTAWDSVVPDYED